MNPPNEDLQASPPQHGGFMVRIHEHLVRYGRAVAGLLLLCWGIAFWLGGQARTDNGTLAFFPDSNPEMARMAEAMDMAPFSRLLLVDFAAEEKGREQSLAAMANAVLRDIPPELARRSGQLSLPEPLAIMRLLPSLVDEETLAVLEKAVLPQAMNRAMIQARQTISGLWGSMGVPWIRQDPLNFRRILLERLPPPPSTGLSDPLLGFPLSSDGKHILLVLRPTRSLHDVDHATALMRALNASIAAHTTPGIRVTVVGAHRHSATNTAVIQRDIQRIVLLSLAGFALTYLILVRSARGAMWLLLTPLAAASLAMGGVSLTWPVVSGLALGFGASVLGIAEDYAVHMHFALRCARSRGESTGAVLDALALPLFQGFLLNATGFVVLLFSGIPALRQLAGFSLFTLGAGLFLALFVLPLCPGFDAGSPPAPRRALAPRFPRLKPVLVCALSLLAVCIFLWKAIHIDISPRSLGAEVAAIQQDGAMLKSIWGGGPEHIWVVRGKDSTETLEHTRLAAHTLRQTGVAVYALSDIWPSPLDIHANVRRWQNFLRAHPRLVEDVTAQGKALGFTSNTFTPLAQWLAEEALPMDEEALRRAHMGDMVDTFLEVGEDQHGNPRAMSLIIAQVGDTDVGVANAQPPPPFWSEISNTHEVRDLAVVLSPKALESALLLHLERERWLFPVTALACVVLLRLCLGSLLRTLLAALPALAALATVLGWLCWSDSALNLAGMAALPLVLGLAVDHGVVVTHDLAHGVHHGIQRAILVSSLTALTGMGVLALAEHPALRDMGQVIFIGLMVEMITALGLLPLLCCPADEEK